MLLLVFRVAGQTYAVEAPRVVEVVPRVHLRPLPHAPEGLAGLLRYRGRMVPVVDLGIVLGHVTCPALLSTRIILVDDHLPPRNEAALGLLGEQVINVRRVADNHVIPSPPLIGENPYLGPIVSTDDGLIP